MFLLRKPSDEIIARFIASQQELPFSYAQVGATRNSETDLLRGYTVDHNRTLLGKGEQTYQRAIAALQGWRQFELGWVTVVPRGRPLQVGTTVAVQASTFGVWSLSATRIVYLVDERVAKHARFGFAYGTLPDHVECGEERFTVEWREDDSVWYDIYAFSRPRHPLVRASFPVARRLQKQFARESLAVMKAEALK
jgi:uncharacterized protein (UPF0548 family)